MNELLSAVSALLHTHIQDLDGWTTMDLVPGGGLVVVACMLEWVRWLQYRDGYLD